MDIEIYIAETESELEKCFDTFSVLRPHLDLDKYLSQVLRQQKNGFQVLALAENGIVQSVAGFRFSEFLAWGKVLYIDDLSTLPTARSKEFGDKLLTWLIDHAKDTNCQGIHLDTGYSRNAAHKLYLKKGFQLSCHHLSQEFKNA